MVRYILRAAKHSPRTDEVISIECGCVEVFKDSPDELVVLQVLRSILTDTFLRQLLI